MKTPEQIRNSYTDKASRALESGDMVAYEMYMHNAQQWAKRGEYAHIGKA